MKSLEGMFPNTSVNKMFIGGVTLRVRMSDLPILLYRRHAVKGGFTSTRVSLHEDRG